MILIIGWFLAFFLKQLNEANDYLMKIILTLIIIILKTLNCFSQKKNKSIFILFEKNIDGMYKWHT